MPPDLHFAVTHATPVPYAAVPTLAFHLQLKDAASAQKTPIQSLILHVQIRIEPTRRSYSPEQQERLFELFGPPEIWHRTLHSMLWTHADITVPAFAGGAEVELPIACSFDFNVAATRYFAALEPPADSRQPPSTARETPVIPLAFLFSGTIFHQTTDGRLQIARVSWEKDADFPLPYRIWADMMDRYYPHTAWLCIHRDLVNRLADYQRRHALPTFEHALDQLLAQIPQESVP